MSPGRRASSAWTRPVGVLLAVVLLAGCLGACGQSSGRTNRPDPPDGVTATPGIAQVTLDWSAVPGASSYNVYWGTSPGVTKATGNPIPTAAAPYDHTGLTVGTTYYYVITTLRGGLESSESVEVSAAPVAPPPPTGVTAVAGNTTVTIDWQPIAVPATYNLYWLDSPGVTIATGNPVTGVTAPFDHTGLANGTTYYYVVTSVVALAESAESAEVSATPHEGVPDPSFGGGGSVTHDSAAGGASHDYAYAITVDGSGRVVVAGSSAQAVASNPDMVIWRFNDDGSFDTTFNSQGWVTYHNAAGGDGIDNGFGMTLDGSGRIVVTGASWNASGNYDMVIWRYDTTGTIDPAFGTGGLVVFDAPAPPTSQDSGYGIIIDASNRILVAGSTSGPSGTGDMTIWRYNDNGTLDTTFNGQGWVTHDNAAGGSGSDAAFDIALDGTGRIVAAGQSTSAAAGFDVAAWRLNADGSLDATFNGQGWVTEDSSAGGPGNDWGRAIALDASGRILVGGHSWQGITAHDLAIWCFTSGGTLDPTFASGGLLLHDGAAGGSGEEAGHDIAMDSLGRIYITGYSGTGAGDKDMVILRCLSDGSLDTAFGGQGWVTDHDAAGGGDDDEGRAIAFDGIGRTLVAGSSRNAAGNFDIVVWRFR